MNNKKFWVSLTAGILAFVMILGLLIGILPTVSAATSSSEIKNQINALQKDQKEKENQIKELEKQLKQNSNQIKDLSNQKGVIEQQLSLISEQMGLINEQISAYAVLIADKQEELDRAEERLAELNRKNKERIRAMEEDGAVSYWSVLFQANSFSDLLDRLNMIQEIAASDARRLKEMSQVAKEIAEVKATLVTEKAALEDSRAAMEAKEVEFERKAEQANEVMAQLIAKGQEFEDLKDDWEDELNDLELEIANKKDEYDEAKLREWLATSVPPTTKPSSGGSGGTGGSGTNKDGIIWLVPCNYNRVSSKFGPRTHPVTGEVNKMHNGVDLAVGCTPIYATRAGVVTISTYSSTAGNYVKINHGDGYASVYMHMCKAPYVKVGQYVTAGQVIGCVGSTGRSTGSHLHFGISYNGVYVNPLDYIL